METVSWITAGIAFFALIIQAANFMAEKREQALRLFSPIMALLFFVQIGSLAITGWILLTRGDGAELPFVIAAASFALFAGLWLAGYANRFPH